MDSPDSTAIHLDQPTKGPDQARKTGPWLASSIVIILSLFCFGWLAEAVRNRNGFNFQSSFFLGASVVVPTWLTALSLIRRKTWAALNVKRKLLAFISGLFASSAVVLAGYVTGDLVHDNLRVVVPGQAYRAGQMTSDALAETIQTYGIKSILNLRGSNVSHLWYQNEIQTAAKFNVQHYDLGISAGQELEQQEMNQISAILRNAPKPILIHCYGGADRSGLASAIYLYAIVGTPAEKAAGELSVWNGHVPMLRPWVSAMDNSFSRYVSNRVAQAEHELQHGK